MHLAPLSPGTEARGLQAPLGLAGTRIVLGIFLHPICQGCQFRVDPTHRRIQVQPQEVVAQPWRVLEGGHAFCNRELLRLPACCRAPDYGTLRDQAMGQSSHELGINRSTVRNADGHSSAASLLELMSAQDTGLPFLPTVYSPVQSCHGRELMNGCHGISRDSASRTTFLPRQWGTGHLTTGCAHFSKYLNTEAASTNHHGGGGRRPAGGRSSRAQGTCPSDG